MASTPALKPSSPEPSSNQKPQLSPEYRKAHKNYVLVAGLLASWELIGINLKTGDKWGIELTSPKAVPLILFTLLIYSAYKLVIEWQDCEGPKSKPAKIDFVVAHLIAASAVLIGIVQALLKIRIADIVAISDWYFVSAAISSVSGMICTVLIFALYKGFVTVRSSRIRWLIVFSTTFVLLSLLTASLTIRSFHATLVGFVFGALIPLLRNGNDLRELVTHLFKRNSAPE